MQRIEVNVLTGEHLVFDLTPEEIAALPAPVAIDPKIAIQAQIDELERTQLLPRISREFMLLQFASVATQQGVDPMTNIAFSRLKAFDDQVAALRAKL